MSASRWVGWQGREGRSQRWGILGIQPGEWEQDLQHCYHKTLLSQNIIIMKDCYCKTLLSQNIVITKHCYHKTLLSQNFVITKHCYHKTLFINGWQFDDWRWPSFYVILDLARQESIIMIYYYDATINTADNTKAFYLLLN